MSFHPPIALTLAYQFFFIIIIIFSWACKGVVQPNSRLGAAATLFDQIYV